MLLPQESAPQGAAPRRRAAALWLLFLAALSAFAAGPMAWAAGPDSSQPPTRYIFHLRNGSQIQTSNYWEEGDEYRLEQPGGVIGVHTSDVQRIDRIREAPAPKSGPATSRSPWASVAETIERMRARLAWIWTPKKSGGATPLARGGKAAVRGAPARGGGPPIVVLVAVAVAVPILIFAGKRLGSWWFSTGPSRTG